MTQNDMNSPSEELSVGQTLRQEREKRKLTIEQAAQQLKLKVDVIRSLEQDAPDKSILPTFMRGYLKSYARFLKLPEQPLLDRFEKQHQVKSAPVKSMRTFSNRSARQRTEKRFVWLTWLIGILLFVSLAAWIWQTAREYSPLTESSQQIGTERSLDAVVAEKLVETNDHAEDNIAAMSATVLNNTSPQLSSVADQALTSEQLVSELTQLPVEVQQQLLELANATLDESNATDAASVSREPGFDQLKMTFTDNCWIDVLDANGDRIAFGTKQAGYVMELNAKGPFVITLGNPGVVSIELNDQPYDMSRFPGNRVAKFTLSGQNE